jgi:hypothetical protein
MPRVAALTRVNPGLEVVNAFGVRFGCANCLNYSGMFLDEVKNHRKVSELIDELPVPEFKIEKLKDLKVVVFAP